MKITFFQRKPFQDFVSIEHIYDMIRATLPKKVIAITHISKFQSKGVFKRIYNIFEAAFNQGDVNHVTGDIHFVTFLLKSSKTILSIHDIHFLKDKKGLRYWFLKLFWIDLPYKKVQFITTVSEYTKKSIVELLNEDISSKIKVIGNPVNPLFKKNPHVFNKSCPILLQVGTKKHKGLHNLIRAIEGISCELFIIGTLKEDDLFLLEKFKIKYSNFVNLPIEQLVKLYENADLITFVSTHEGFGMPIIEANAIGRAVITGNSTSIPEVANDAALMVNPLDIQAIRNGVLKLINNDDYRNQLIENGFENAKRFEVKTIAGQYLELYKDVLEY